MGLGFQVLVMAVGACWSAVMTPWAGKSCSGYARPFGDEASQPPGNCILTVVVGLLAPGFSELRSYGGGVGRNYSDASEGSAGGSFSVSILTP